MRLLWKAAPKKLLDRVSDAIRMKHYARNTEQAYVYWIKKYILTINATIAKNTTYQNILTSCLQQFVDFLSKQL